MTPFIKKAYEFANTAHHGQQRKYTREPYIVHPLEVMEIVQTVTDNEVMLAAALLHDVVEDTAFTLEEIYTEFGKEVADLVNELTDKSQLEDGNRALRKAIDRDSLANASAAAQTIKLADLISNTKSITEHDPKFAKVYLAEKRLLLKVLTKGHAILLDRAKVLEAKNRGEG